MAGKSFTAKKNYKGYFLNLRYTQRNCLMVGIIKTADFLKTAVEKDIIPKLFF